MDFYSIRKAAVALVSCVLLLMAQGVYGQTMGSAGLPSAKVDQMSDQQIMQLWQQAQRSGMSETDVMNLLVKRGLPASEVTSLKKRLVQLQSKSRNGSSQNLIRDSANFMKDSSWVAEIPAIRRKSLYYGFDFFNNANRNFEPNLRLTTPLNYVLGPGDEFTVNYTGVNESSVEGVRVDANGFIQIPYGGRIQVNGNTIEQATEKIKDRMKIAYSGLSSGRTQVFITLSNFKTIRVTVVGEAESPGNFVVSSLASLANVLYLADGPSENGSLRKIELIRNGKVIETVDFYAFLQKGILNKEVRLQDQDVIRFPLYQKRVALSGQVKRPYIYELLDKETLGDLLQYGGGLKDDAIRDVAKVVQNGEREKRVRDVSLADFNYFIPRDGDSVFIDKVLPVYSNRVVLSGAVYRPGNYELTDKLTLKSLIAKADGLKEDAFVNRGLIKRKVPGSEGELISFNTGNIISGKQPDITLVKEDSVFILSKDSLKDARTITVGGNVKMPTTFAYREGMSLEDAILLAGGFTNEAASHKVEISRLEMNRSDTLANQLLDLITVDVDSTFAGTNNKMLLQPQDYIFVPRLLNYHNLGTVKIRGEVLYAGDYALERRNETIQELIRRSGGISPFASLADVQVFRNGLRVGTNLVSSQYGPADRFLLLPNDSIFVPRNEPFVEIQGNVFNPQIVSYQSDNFLSYISASGGVTDKGNLRKAYIQYSNGMNRKIRHFLFFRRYPKVLPGSRIVVPEKPLKLGGLTAVEASAIFGSLATLVSVLIVLLK